MPAVAHTVLMILLTLAVEPLLVALTGTTPGKVLLGMRLGEGSGCPLAFEILDAACAIINDMATFDQAGINDDYLEPIRKGDQFSVEGGT